MSSLPGSGKRVLLTGASGFIAAHVLKILIAQGFWVRATVRSEAKQKGIEAVYPDAVKSKQLEFAIVEDIAVPHAHDKAVVADPPLDYVLHTASPFHMNIQDPKKDMLDPAVNGTRGLLESVKQHAPSVKRVVITSSFASILNPDRLSDLWPGKVYSEEDWNPITWERATSDPSNTYRGSKTFAEKAGWEFIEKEKPNFDLVTLCPPMVYGPIINDQTLASLNTSNQRINGYLSGQLKEVAPTGVHLWIDVRDLALAHVLALTVPAAGGNRFFTLADGTYSNQEICDYLRKHFAELRGRVPEGKPGTGLGRKEGEYFVGDNSKSKKILGITYRGLEESVVDTARSILELEKKSA